MNSVNLYRLFRKGCAGGALRQDLKKYDHYIRQAVESWGSKKKVEHARLQFVYDLLVANSIPSDTINDFVMFVCFCAHIDFVNGDKFCLQFLKTLPDMPPI